jgi:hypothetical protein
MPFNAVRGKDDHEILMPPEKLSAELAKTFEGVEEVEDGDKGGAINLGGDITEQGVSAVLGRAAIARQSSRAIV